jgi:hypothetical protein
MRRRSPEGTVVKTWVPTVMLLTVWMLILPLSFAQMPISREPVPEYNMAQEAKFKGIVEEVSERLCPMTGSMDWHLMVRIENKIYEVHVAPVKFAKIYEADVHKGDRIEIVGVKTQFQHADVILSREIKDGNHVLLFRDEKGKPFW